MQANLLVSEWLMIGKEESEEHNININEEEVKQSAHASKERTTRRQIYSKIRSKKQGWGS